MGKNVIPERWVPYSPMGKVVPGTRFVACKVPLKETLLKKLPENERFGPEDLVKAFPNLGLLVDLTNTTRYYLKQEFTERNIQYEKIFCPGKVIPPNSIIKKFFSVVDRFLDTHKNSDNVIVVHCTHGVNRTGYFICRYMIQRMNISPEEALTNFQLARGHDIERDSYLHDLRGGCQGGSESDLQFTPNGLKKMAIQEKKRAREARHARELAYQSESLSDVEVIHPIKKYRDHSRLVEYHTRGGGQGRGSFFAPRGSRGHEDNIPGQWRREQVNFQAQSDWNQPGRNQRNLRPAMPSPPPLSSEFVWTPHSSTEQPSPADHPFPTSSWRPLPSFCYASAPNDQTRIPLITPPLRKVYSPKRFPVPSTRPPPPSVMVHPSNTYGRIREVEWSDGVGEGKVTVSKKRNNNKKRGRRNNLLR